MRLSKFISDNDWFHTFLGVTGHALFFGGSLAFATAHETLAKYLFLVGSGLMLVGYIGMVIAKTYEKGLLRLSLLRGLMVRRNILAQSRQAAERSQSGFLRQKLLRLIRSKRHLEESGSDKIREYDQRRKREDIPEEPVSSYDDSPRNKPRSA